MDWSILSIVRIDFPTKALTEDTIQTIEELLRKEENIDNLGIHSKMVSFYIWSRRTVDYTILDALKRKLKSLGYVDFEISAEEYAKSGKGYRYPANKS
jgi:hypothetical protein